MSHCSHATAVHCRAAHRCRLGNLETHVECVPRPRHWGGSFELQNRRKCCCFIPALTDWSPAVMFDAVTPFADVRKNYFPIEIPGDGWFPVVDELGSPLGIWIKPTESGLDSECQLRIETLAGADFGATAVLEVEFDRPGYYNGLRLTPFVNMPIHLTKIIADGMFTTNDSPVFPGDALIDRP